MGDNPAAKKAPNDPFIIPVKGCIISSLGGIPIRSPWDNINKDCTNPICNPDLIRCVLRLALLEAITPVAAENMLIRNIINSPPYIIVWHNDKTVRKMKLDDGFISTPYNIAHKEDENNGR